MRLLKKYVTIILLAYLSVLLYWMFIGFGRSQLDTWHYNIVPFRTVYEYTVTGIFSIRLWMINMLGNIIVFVPFGLLLPILFENKKIKMFVIYEGGLLFLEVMQMVTKRGIFDVDDIILNSLGMVIGYYTYKLIKATVKKYNKRSDMREYYENNTR